MFRPFENYIPEESESYKRYMKGEYKKGRFLKQTLARGDERNLAGKSGYRPQISVTNKLTPFQANIIKNQAFNSANSQFDKLEAAKSHGKRSMSFQS